MTATELGGVLAVDLLEALDFISVNFAGDVPDFFDKALRDLKAWDDGQRETAAS